MANWFNKPVVKDQPSAPVDSKPVSTTAPTTIHTSVQESPRQPQTQTEPRIKVQLPEVKTEPPKTQSYPARPSPPPTTSSPDAPPKPLLPKATSQQVVDLTIGFDLGTSCSKISIGDSVLGRQYAVPFNFNHRGIEKYLCPTRFSERNGSVSLSPTADEKIISNLKLRLSDAVENQAATAEPELDLAIYVAIVLTQVLAWYEQERANDHRSRTRCWWLSIGFPAKRVDNNPKLHQAYQRFVAAAIRAVNSGEVINRALVQRCLVDSNANPDKESQLSSERVNFYPEIAAQLAGYAVSRNRVHGPLMLIDVGAGTLDISTLILHQRDQEEFCSFQFCEVAQLGAFRMYQQLHQALAAISPHTVEPMVSIGADQNWRVPESASQYLRSTAVVTSSMKNGFYSARESFADKCLDQALSNFSAFKRYLDKPFREVGERPKAFRKNVHIILSGGGSRVAFYRKLFPDQLEEVVLKSGLTLWNHDPAHRRIHGEGFHIRHLVQPDNFMVSGISSDEFDRLSVAHGLSLSSETILQITAKEMSDRQWNNSAK